MALRQCDICSEMVDEAKAFCPGCGHAFVEEQTRSAASNFDTMDSTVQLGQTMYNQMLSDMGLNTSKAPNAPEKRVEVVTPLAPAAKQVAKAPETPTPAGGKKWLILAGVVLVLFFLLLIALGIAGFFFYNRFN